MDNRAVWDDGHWSALPSLDGDVRADACVVGLGASGLTAIAELAARGRSVVGVDAGVVGGGASGRNGGILRAGTSHYYHDAVDALGHARARRLYELTAAELDRVVRETPAAFRRVGVLRIAADDAEWLDCELQLDALLADDVDVKRVDSAFGRGVFVATDGAMQPELRCRTLARALLEPRAPASSGGDSAAHPNVRLFEGTPVTAIDTGEVTTTLGRVQCDTVIVAVDGGLEDLIPALIGTVRTTRLQMLATEPANDVTIPCPMSANGGFDYWQQLPDGRIALGGGRNRAMDREWGAAPEPTSEIQDYLDSVLRERIRTGARVTHRWAARVAYTSSGLPVLSEVAPSVWAVGGYCGTGNLFGPMCGRAAAQIACGESPELVQLLSQATAQTC
ncbi:MAG: FAD-binding oxidoreductase [Gemmatimonadetes bacterium]|nr:FAD-binding oxidoreductase [Gemmatimonadota bacterium]